MRLMAIAFCCASLGCAEDSAGSYGMSLEQAATTASLAEAVESGPEVGVGPELPAHASGWMSTTCPQAHDQALLSSRLLSDAVALIAGRFEMVRTETLVEVVPGGVLHTDVVWLDASVSVDLLGSPPPAGRGVFLPLRHTAVFYRADGEVYQEVPCLNEGGNRVGLDTILEDQGSRGEVALLVQRIGTGPDYIVREVFGYRSGLLDLGRGSASILEIEAGMRAAQARVHEAAEVPGEDSLPPTVRQDPIPDPSSVDVDPRTSSE